MRHRMLVTSLAVALAATPLPAAAQLTQVFSPAGLGAGPFTVHDFEVTNGGPGATYSALGGVQRVNARSVSSGVTTSGVFVLAASNGGLNNGAITIEFDAPTRAFGLNFGNDASSFTVNPILSAFNGATPLGTLTVVANLNDFVDQFIGFTSTTDVTSVVFDYQRPAAANLAVAIDDVRFNVVVAAVPEPGTAGLVGAGAALVAGLATRRRRR